MVRIPSRFCLAFTLTAAAVFLSLAPTALAQSQPFGQWLDEVRREAVARGIRQATVDDALVGITPIPRVLELDRRQPEFTLTFQQYMDRVVPLSRIEQGRRKLAENQALLGEIGRKYGVQPRFLVAFWGIETDFGRITGGFQVVPALATLAYDGRRSSYFRDELFNALKIVDQGHVKSSEMMGSWAGAMGQCQFMPSSFMAYAVDENGDGRKDIWTTPADVFASAANYLARSGWKNDETWGRAVRLPPGFDVSLVNMKVRKPLDEWQKLGVRRADGHDLPKRDLMASLAFADKPGGPVFLVYGNFQAILKWNRSIYFAVAVGVLADGLQNG